MVTASALVLAMALDAVFGEPKRWHPLVGFGGLAHRLEGKLNGPGAGRATGAMAVGLLLLPVLFFSVWLWWWLVLVHSALAIALGALGLYLSVGARSLREHVRAVAAALDRDDLPRARQQVQYLVSRDCSALTTEPISRATIESLLENASDAIVAPLFWFLVAGLPGALIYRLSNTLDAMWGYRNERFNAFGWAAARLDDGLNLVPARLTALAYALTGNGPAAMRVWRTSAHHWASPNAGPVLASGAGALQISLGGGARYHGQWQDKPATEGRAPVTADIDRALLLVTRSVLLLLALMVLLAVRWML